ncbi:SGNH/GDSL hydrolase family protein [Salinithrix halophila]|uniref:SGNH/GDSL hydrolase family protein n=1 Tax=Salinithrix halophila TaxID=1485204 RepID=A0ABV8JED0_9BACL
MNGLKQPVTYLALGDSLTEGIGADGPDRHLVAQVFDYLRKTEQCRVQNWGISGLTSRELFELLQTPALMKLLPRVSHITITTGGCDFIEWFEEGANLMGLVKTMRRVRNQAEKILSLVRKSNPDGDVQMLGFYLPIPAYELGLAMASRAVQTMNLSYSELCRKYEVQLVNPFEHFLHRKDYFADDVHPNQQGYDELARLFLSTVPEKSPPPEPTPSPQESMA